MHLGNKPIILKGLTDVNISVNMLEYTCILCHIGPEVWVIDHHLHVYQFFRPPSYNKYTLNIQDPSANSITQLTICCKGVLE